MSLENYRLKSLKDKLREQEEKRRLDEVLDATVEGKEVPKARERAKNLKVETKLGGKIKK